jgi:outer membrane PBP1 activator LpoA protein
LIIVLATMLAACPSLGPRTGPAPSVDRAERLSQQGDLEGAARVYEALARDNQGGARVDLGQRAARAWLAARRPDEARRVLQEIAPEPHTADQSLERTLLEAEIALEKGENVQAWNALSAVPEPAAPAAAQRYFASRERAAFATNRVEEGVRASLAGERFITTPAERATGRARLLGELRSASEQGLRIEPAGVQDAIVRGWLELAPIAALAARDPLSGSAAVSAWRRRNPGHPALEVVRREVLGEDTGPGSAAFPAGPHVALLLPVSGRQAGAAAAVREGFLTAYYQTPATARPRLRIYDTAELSVEEAIERAASTGADYIVGPLTRDEVASAADYAGDRPPILALNFLAADRSAPQRFHQFALSPEEEAREVAQRVLAAGQRRGIVLAPEGDWGDRVAAAFRDELLAGGGEVLAEESYDATRNDFSQWIQPALRLSDSRARHRRLEEILGAKLELEPRRRGDIDFIFAPAQAPVARMMRPQLRFHYAGDIPTYATSDAFEPDERANQDLDGLIFPDMPWMLGGSALVEEVREATRAAWGEGGPRRTRLFAFGYDAWRVLEALRTNRLGGAFEVPGLTGRLSVDALGRVHRELDWGQLRGGAVRLLPPTAP